MDPFHGDDPLTAPELERCFQCICEDAEGLSSRPRISSLTRVNRDEWSENRNYLISLHNCNRESLKVVEDCMFMVILDEEQPSDESEVCQKLITGLPDNRWADKSLSVIQFANGFGGISCDHSPMDAMVGIIMSHFIHIGIKDMQGRWPGDFQGQNRDVKRPKLLQWKIDDKLEAAIDNGRKMAENLSHDVLLKRKAFKVFGKTGIKKLHINPDTFVQMALQLAYYRLHDRPAPTYETATTRKFRLGRTETLRSCSQDVVAFLVAMEDISTDVSKKRKLLETAISTHNKNMKEAKEGRGCDRHLLGLSILALQNGYQQVEEIKAFYSDPSFFKSGGGGNFLLSTSTSGYTPMAGGTTSMVENGYGVFYNFEEDKIWIWVTSYRRSTQTSTEKFLRAIETSLTDLYTLLSSRNSKI